MRQTTLRLVPLAAVAAVIGALAALVAGFADNGDAASGVAPSNTSPPTISGTAKVGSQLTASTGTWTGTEPIQYSYRWLRCDNTGGSCSSISGATDKTYTLKTVDVDNTLRVRVTAKNASGTDSATSVPTAVVTAEPKPPATGCPSGNGPVKVSDVTAPARLVIDRFTVDPSVVTRGTEQVIVQAHVSDTCGQTVQGALVYGTAVPFAQLNVPAEQPTDANGVATIQFQVLAGFPAARNQQLLVFFLRARKPGDNVLTGISTRRLVSSRVSLGT
jgi:hypothetical protein